jgi:hypothetical protein
LALAVSTAQAQNLLVDPGFEAPVFGQPNPIPVPGGVNGGWAGFGASLTTSIAYAGSQSALLADNSWTPTGVYQIINATAGSTYTASAEFYRNGAATGWGTPFLINLEFHDAAGAQVGTTASTGWAAGGADGTWALESCAGLAPAGTDYAYIYFMAMNSVVTEATFAVDNASVTVPEPASMTLLGLGLAGALVLRRRQ